MVPISEHTIGILEHAPDAILLVDAEGIVIWANLAAETLLGSTRPALVDSRLRDMAITEHGASSNAGSVLGDGDPAAREVDVRVVELDQRQRAVFLREPVAGMEPQTDSQMMLASWADGEALAHVGSWRIDLRTMEGAFSDEFYRIHGLDPQERTLDVFSLRGLLHPDDRGTSDRLLEAITEHPEDFPEEGISSGSRLVLPDGTVRDVRFHARIARDEAGTAAFFVGVVHDITPQRRLERKLSAHHAVSRALRDWVAFDQGVVGLLRRFGSALELPVGELWTWSAASEQIVCRAFWSARGVEADEFEIRTREVTHVPRVGAIGRAWESHSPIVVDDLHRELELRRVGLAARLGLTSELIFPAVGPDGTLAVVAFYGQQRIESTDLLVETLGGIGAELGRFLSTRRGELEPQGLTPRELQVLQHAADGQTGREIAHELTIGASTVKTHFEHIYEKIGVGDRAAAVAYGLRFGLIV